MVLSLSKLKFLQCHSEPKANSLRSRLYNVTERKYSIKISTAQYQALRMMKTWQEFSFDDPELAAAGLALLFQSGPPVGLAFLATLRKDGAPRLHPISLVFSKDHLYLLIPPTSPKCSDLKRDGRYALQAFPPPNNEDNEEFYLAGHAERIPDPEMRQALIADTTIKVEEGEVLFELLLDRAMYTRLVNRGIPEERPIHKKWRSN